MIDEHREPPEPPEPITDPPPGLKLMPGNASKKAERSWRVTGPIAQPRAAALEPPYEMIDTVAAIWVETTAHLEAMKILEPAHRHLIAAYCEQAAVVEKCTDLINRTSLLVNGARKTLVPNKLLAIRRDALAQMHKLAQEFGLTPALAPVSR